jgi:hypothetical protein
MSLIARRVATYRFVVCGAPGYLKRRGTPKLPADLLEHNCLGCSHSAGGDEWRFVGPDGEQSVALTAPRSPDPRLSGESADMDELNPRLGGVSFFQLGGARTYDETDSIVPPGATAVRRARSNLLLPWQARATMRALVLHPATTAWISTPPRLSRLTGQTCFWRCW